jgi:cytoskeletal protein CcmA (bactofilin family)
MFGKNQPVVSTKNVETIIGPSVKVEGDFRGEGDLIIEGILIGNLNTKNNLKIGQGAVVEATIKANNAFIAGKVKGNISIKGKLDITGSAVIVGDVRAAVLSIEAGALIQGNVSMPTDEASRREDAHATSKKESRKNEVEEQKLES